MSRIVEENSPYPQGFCGKSHQNAPGAFPLLWSHQRRRRASKRDPVANSGPFWSYSRRRRRAGRIEGSEGYRISTPLPVA